MTKYCADNSVGSKRTYEYKENDGSNISPLVCLRYFLSGPFIAVRIAALGDQLHTLLKFALALCKKDSGGPRFIISC
jgi:hypothetical protein